MDKSPKWSACTLVTSWLSLVALDGIVSVTARKKRYLYLNSFSSSQTHPLMVDLLYSTWLIRSTQVIVGVSKWMSYCCYLQASFAIFKHYFWWKGAQLQCDHATRPLKVFDSLLLQKALEKRYVMPICELINSP